ncbi:hypothetical protein PGB90_008235 [Kerria lacca]
MNNNSHEDSDDEKTISNLNWRRKQEQLYTDGFRAGAITGKNKILQEGFDNGYADGFKKSYNLGIKTGEERILQFLNNRKDHGFSVVDNLRTSAEKLCDMCSKMQDKT